MPWKRADATSVALLVAAACSTHATDKLQTAQLWPQLPDGWLQQLQQVTGHGAEEAALIVLPNGYGMAALAAPTGPDPVFIADPSAPGALSQWVPTAAAGARNGGGGAWHDIAGKSVDQLAIASRWPGGGRNRPPAVVVFVPAGDYFVFPALAVGHRVTVMLGAGGRGSKSKKRRAGAGKAKPYELECLSAPPFGPRVFRIDGFLSQKEADTLRRLAA